MRPLQMQITDFRLQNKFFHSAFRILNSAIILFFLLISRSAFAALDLGFAKEDGGHAGAFLDFAASARSLGMGRAHTAIADDAGAVYWNPSGLSQLERKDVVTLYSMLYEDTGYGFVSYAQPIPDMGTFGLALVSLRSGEFEKRRGIERLGTFTQSELGLLLSHGIGLGPRWSLGYTIKGVRQEIDTASDIGYGVDIGALHRIFPSMQMGLTARNLLSPKIRLRSETDTYPLDLRLGLKWQAGRRLIFSTDLANTKDRSTKLYFGTEWRLHRTLALRAGLNESEATMGLGFQFADWGLDYAFGYHDALRSVTDLGASHRLGFHVSFGPRISEQAGSLRWQRKGKVLLGQLQNIMDKPQAYSWETTRKLVSDVHQVIRRQGYVRPQDLYTAQGYVYFFRKEYERSVQALGEALNLDLSNTVLARHLDQARAHMTEERTKEIVAFEIGRAKELYDKGDFSEALKACDKVLSFRPDHVEATAYREDTLKRIREPIEREMKIAKIKFDRGDYLDAIKSLQKVKEMDPNNKEAADFMNRAIAALEKQAVQQTNDTGAVIQHAVYEIPRDATKSRELYSRGLLLYSQGKIKDAVLAWEQAVKYDQGNVLARNAYHRAVSELKEKPE